VRDERNSLERLLSPHEVFPIANRQGVRGLTWLQADGWRVYVSPTDADDDRQTGTNFQRFTLPGGQTLDATALDGTVTVPFNLAEAHANLVSERWRAGSPKRGLSTRQLDAYYRAKRFIPRQVQLGARKLLVRKQGLPEFPAWPLEQSVDRLVRFYARCLLLAGGKQELTFDWFWPRPYHAALVLTHDVESAEGLRLATEIADLEEERGLRSSFNIVARDYRIDELVVEELRARGFELGVHGVHHDRSMFSSRTEFERQIPVVRRFAEQIGAGGFRSPATHRVFEWLGDLPAEYDCSVPHSDPFEPIPGGCCSLWPFFVGDVIELPYTLPQDHTLFTLLGHSTVAVWESQLADVERLAGLAQLVTHPDPGYLGDQRKRLLYAEFLDLLCERPEIWKALPREVARWWRGRDAGASDEWTLGLGKAIHDDMGEVRLEPAFAGVVTSKRQV
jgi:peptidoglycan/xylan/chitin deacetylase (PgdA/CDA1 family)